MKKILVVSYYWPPSGGSGVQRWLYFCHYLQAQGFDITVLTVDPASAAFPSLDYSLLEKTKGITVVHTKSRLNPIKLYASFKKGKLKNQIPAGNFGSKNKSALDHIAGFIRANFFIPDARVTWNKLALKKAIALVESHKFDQIITTGPPHSTHLIGLALKNKFQINWLADFRDPWGELYYNNLFKRFEFAKNKDVVLEKLVLEKADKILTVGPSLKEILQHKLDKNPSKVHVIYNGFDADMFTKCTDDRSSLFTIAHIGNWSMQQAHQEIIAALQEICGNRKIKIRFLLAGKVDQFIVDQLRAIENLTVDFKGLLSHQNAINEMYNADILLNCHPILPNAEYMISGKMMEYLASGNYNITIGNKNSDGAKILASFPSAKMIGYNATEELILLISDRLSSDRSHFDLTELLAKYTRKAAAQELIQLINQG